MKFMSKLLATIFIIASWSVLISAQESTSLQKASLWK